VKGAAAMLMDVNLQREGILALVFLSQPAAFREHMILRYGRS
jgi:hypothetical protein